MTTQTPSIREALSLADRIENALRGHETWRVMNRANDGYCMEFASPEYFNPERACDRWLAEQNPEWIECNGYHAVKSFEFTTVERMALDAAKALRAALSAHPEPIPAPDLSKDPPCIFTAEPESSTHPEPQPVASVEPNNEEVICPACTHQFRAIPVQVQQLMLKAGFEPPFTQEPAHPAGQEAEQALRAIELIASGHSTCPREDAYNALPVLRAILTSKETLATHPVGQEALRLASVLRGMVECGPAPDDLWERDQPDGDPFVVRAAELLEILASKEQRNADR